MNEVLAAIKARRSVRKFAPGEVADAKLTAILDAGRWTPSGKNTQPWRFVVVRSPEKREALARLAPQDRMIATAPVTIAVLYNHAAGYDELKDAHGIGAAIQSRISFLEFTLLDWPRVGWAKQGTRRLKPWSKRENLRNWRH